MKTTALIFAAITGALSLSAEVFFEEDFTNYGDKAPGVIDEGTEVINDPIHARAAYLNVNVDKDSDIFLKPIMLPACKDFDICFSFQPSATNAEVDIVLTAKDGKALTFPVTGLDNAKHFFIAKASDGQLNLFRRDSFNVWQSASSATLVADAATLNFRAKAGVKFGLSDILVRSPAPVPSSLALAQFPAVEVLTRQLGNDAPASDAAPIDILGKSISFIPGATGICATIEFVWDNGFKQKHDVAVVEHTHSSPIKSYAMPQLGLKPQETWHGPDAAIDFGSKGSLARQFVRPSLWCFTTYSKVCDKGVDIVRDWNTLPPASQHLVTFELRKRDDGAVEVWVDGSFFRVVTAPEKGLPGNIEPPKFLMSATLTFKNPTKYRFNEITPDALELWANPRAKAFVAAAPDSADVAICHSAQLGYSLDADGYNSRQAGLGYPGEVHFRLPAAPYAKATIDFVLDDAEGKVPFLAVRMTRYDSRYGIGNTMIEDTDVDFTQGIPESVKTVGELVRGGKKFPIYRMDVELPTGRVLDLAAGDYIDLEFLGPKDIAYQQLDYRQKPREDVSSSFNLLAVKLEKLNVLPEIVQITPGNVFTEDEKVKKTSVKLTACVDGASGMLRFDQVKNPLKSHTVNTAIEPKLQAYTFAVQAYTFAKKGDSQVFDFDFSNAGVGFYDLKISVADSAGRAIVHPARYCVTPAVGRLATPEESPYATWWFIGSHGSPKDWSIAGPILRKAGIARVDAKTATKEDLETYHATDLGKVYAPKLSTFDEAKGEFKPGKIKRDGVEVDATGEEVFVDAMKSQIAKAHFADHVMIWHESAPNCGIPEEVLGMPSPTNDVEREKRMAAYINETGRLLHKHFPNLRIAIGNSGASIGAVAVPMRGGAKVEYYDSVGQESVSQTMPPERLIDCALQGQLITKAVAKKLSGKEVATDGCYEFTYRPERDLGYRGEDLQAEYHVRDVLISLMNNYKLISPGLLFDCRNAYCNTVWGASGILLRAPYVYPKKAYLAYAVLTKVLDGVTFVRQIDTGSTTVYAAEFLRKDGKTATAFWCARGEAVIKVAEEGECWTMYGERFRINGVSSMSAFTCGTAPVYFVSDKPLATVSVTMRRFLEDTRFASQGKVVTEFSAANIDVKPDLRFETKHHNFLPILKPGVFTVKDVVDETEGACIEVTLDTSKNADKVTEFITEYTTLRLKTPVEIEGEPDLLGLRVKGNSNWGQLRFEIEDADGEVFSGFSTGKSWGCDVFDWPGYLAVNFDGWSDVYQYTDENTANLAVSPGPRDEQWLSGGGNKKIDFPVKLRAIHVTMNRYKANILGFEPTVPSIRLKKVWALDKLKK